MSRAATNCLIFVLTFLIGSIPSLVPPIRDHDGSEIPQASTIQVDPPGFAYGCLNENAVSFWEKLDKEQFLRQQRAQMTKEDPKTAAKQFDMFQGRFGCSYFTEINREDLDGDGIDELKAVGDEGMRDWPTYIFQQTGSGLQMILAEAWTFEEQHPKTNHHGFRDLVFHTNYTGSYREITRYQFDGRTYVPAKCQSQSGERRTKNDVIQVDPPIVKNISCRDLNLVQP